MKLWRELATSVLLGVSCVSAAYAKPPVSPPQWLNRPPSDDAIYKYFVGRGSAKSEAEAFRSAQRDAVETAIREVYGFKTRLDTKTYENIDNSQVIKRSAEVSEDIQVVGFKQVESFKSEHDGVIDIAVLYKYGKYEIQNEKDRLSSIEKKDVPIELIAIQQEDIKKVVNYKPDYLPGENRVLVSDLAIWADGLPTPYPWAAYLLGSYSSSPFSSGFNYAGVGLALEKRFYRFGIKVTGSAFSTQGSSTDAGLSGYSGQISIPYYFLGTNHNNVFIEPEFARYWETVHPNKANSITGKFDREDHIQQSSYGAAIGCQGLLNAPLGLDLRLGYRFYTGSGSYQGTSSVYVSGGIVFKF